MNKILFFSLSLFSLSFSFCQDFTEDIKWRNPISLESGENSFLAPNFENAHYDNGVPLYFSKQVLKENGLNLESFEFTTENALKAEEKYFEELQIVIREENL